VRYCHKTEILLIFLQCASDFNRDLGVLFLLLIEGGEVLSIIDRTNGSAESWFNKRAGVWPYHRSQTSAKRPDPIFARLLNGLLLRGPKILGSGLYAGEQAMMLRPDSPVRFAGWNSSALISHEGTGRRSPGMSRLTRAFGVPRRTAS